MDYFILQHTQSRSLCLMQNVNSITEDYPALLLMFLTNLLSHVSCMWIFCWNSFGIWYLVTITVIVISCLIQSLFLNFFFLVLLAGFPVTFQRYFNYFQNKIQSAEKVEGFVVCFFSNNKVALPTITEKNWPWAYLLKKSHVPYHQHPPWWWKWSQCISSVRVWLWEYN